MTADRILRVISFNTGANLPQAIDQIRDEDWNHLVELILTSYMAPLCPGAVKESAAVEPRNPEVSREATGGRSRPDCGLRETRSPL
jgi:hypothetical protein